MDIRQNISNEMEYKNTTLSEQSQNLIAKL
jgi:hypothetical protein